MAEFGDKIYDNDNYEIDDEKTDVRFISDDYEKQKKQKDFIKKTLSQITPQNKIGGGANGTVYKIAYNDVLYAVKRIRNDNVEYKLLEHTLDKTKKCSEKIVCFKGYFTIKHDFMYIINAYDDNFKDFGHQMRSQNNKDKYLITWIKPLYQAIQEIHDKKMIHRDIKWDNVIVNNDLTEIKLIDFDSACIKSKKASIAPNSNTDKIRPNTENNQNVRNVGCMIDHQKGSPLFMNPLVYNLLNDVRGPPDETFEKMKSIDLWAFGLFIFRFFSVKMELYERIYKKLFDAQRFLVIHEETKQTKNPFAANEENPFSKKQTSTENTSTENNTPTNVVDRKRIPLYIYNENEYKEWGYMFDLFKLSFFFCDIYTVKRSNFLTSLDNFVKFTQKIDNINDIGNLNKENISIIMRIKTKRVLNHITILNKFRLNFVQSLFYMFKSIDAELSTKFDNKIPSMNKLVPLFNEDLYNASTIIPPKYQISINVRGYSDTKKGGRRKSRRRKHKKRHTKKKRSYKNKKKSRHTK